MGNIYSTSVRNRVQILMFEVNPGATAHVYNPNASEMRGGVGRIASSKAISGKQHRHPVSEKVEGEDLRCPLTARHT